LSRLSVPRLTIEAIHRRSNGRCEMDGLACAHGRHVHHRKPRGMGGSTDDPHRPENLLVIHPNCHLLRVERDRSEAFFFGWLVRRGEDPLFVPVFTHQGWVYLRGGEYRPCTEAQSELLNRLGAADRA
jgi:5-methylcytosine-specific restriction protein A